MKKFLKNMLYFLLPLIIFILGFDVYLRNLNTDYKVREKELLSNKDSIEILVLGNSHAQNGVDPNQFNLYAFNLAYGSQSIYFDKRLTLKYLDDLPKLKYVLISVDYHSLYFSSQGALDYWTYYANGIKYKDKSYLLADISPFLFGYTPKVSVALLKKSIYAWKIKNAINFKDINGAIIEDSILKRYIAETGTIESYFINTTIKIHAESYVQDGLEKAMFEHNNVLKDLEDFILILKNQGITPVLFSTPCYSEFNYYLKEDVLLNNRESINYLCQKFNIKFLNYSNSNLFYKSDFYNSDHLNKTGGAKFGKMLNFEVSKMEQVQN